LKKKDKKKYKSINEIKIEFEYQVSKQELMSSLTELKEEKK
jgi:hypothetical protein